MNHRTRTVTDASGHTWTVHLDIIARDMYGFVPLDDLREALPGPVRERLIDDLRDDVGENAVTISDVRLQAADLIEAAIDVLHERGWCQQSYGLRGHGPVCLAGALTVAARPLSDWNASEVAHRALTDACYAAPNAARSIENFNDLRAQSVEDVLLIAKQAAASLREPQP